VSHPGTMGVFFIQWMQQSYMNNQARILVVDDEPEIGYLLRLFLENDFRVETFTDPRLACEEISTANYDVVVSDIKMPFLSGLEVLKHVKRVRPETHVVLMTGHAQTAKDQAEASALGAAGILFKPFGDPSKVVDYVREVVAKTPAIPVNVGQHAMTEAKDTARVLVIDDDPDLTDVLALILESVYHTKVANSPGEALQCIQSEDFCLVITDLNMPQMNGVELIRRIRKSKPLLPIMIMTGHGKDEPEVIAALEAGGNAVLQKPFPEPTVILEQLKKIVK
jgi:DNA-binding NtrC family response regulator